MTIMRWTLVTRRRDGGINVRRFIRRGKAERAYRSAASNTYMGDNPIVEVWFFRKEAQ